MIIGIGIDIIENQRIEKLIEKYGDKFLEKIFLEDEISYCQHKADFMNCFAARYAAKEALLKSLGTGLRKSSWHDIKIYNDELGKPEINLNGNAAEIADKKGVKNIFLSISHEKNYSVAQVILEGEK